VFFYFLKIKTLTIRPATQNPGFMCQKISVQTTAPRGVQMQVQMQDK
jgi:hypothetical protein